MSKDGYEGPMGDDVRESSSPAALDETVREAAPLPEAPKPRANRRSKTPAPPKAKAQAGERPKKASRKGSGTKSRRPPRVEVDPAKTLQFAPGENPATRIAAEAGFQRDQDDVSIPPASGDLDEHEHFFAQGTTATRSESAPRVVAGRASSDDVATRPLLHPEVMARRERLARFVKVAVAVCGVVCVAGLARATFGHRADRAYTSAAARVAGATPATNIAQAAPVAVDPEPAAEPTEPADPSAPLKSAAEEREDARHALELGKLQDAVDAAQRSITVDPTDAEAWLILGAAWQAQGHGAEARDAFLQCTKQAKTGNVYECGAMLHWNGPPR